MSWEEYNLIYIFTAILFAVNFLFKGPMAIVWLLIYSAIGGFFGGWSGFWVTGLVVGIVSLFSGSGSGSSYSSGYTIRQSEQKTWSSTNIDHKIIDVDITKKP